jgi:hypothetical protein
MEKRIHAGRMPVGLTMEFALSTHREANGKPLPGSGEDGRKGPLGCPT